MKCVTSIGYRRSAKARESGVQHDGSNPCRPGSPTRPPLTSNPRRHSRPARPLPTLHDRGAGAPIAMGARTSIVRPTWISQLPPVWLKCGRAGDRGPRRGGGIMANCLRVTRRVLLAASLLASSWLVGEAREQAVIDEARQAGRAAQTFPAADEDYFRAMDGGIALSPEEVKGRNMWLVWTGGNDRLWDKLTNLTFGAFDLLKILSSSPGLKYG